MDYQRVIQQLSPAIYQQFKTALELGKWPDGRVLTAEQKASCMEAIIAYEAQHLPEEQRTGYIDRGTKTDGEVCDSVQPPTPAGKPIKWH